MSSHPKRSTRVLRSEAIGRIGCYAFGRPYVVPITYAFDGVAVYGHSREGLKLRMMRSHPTVCFEVDRVESALELAQRDRPRDVLRARGEARPRSRWSCYAGASHRSCRARRASPTAALHASGLPWSVFRILLGERTGRFERPRRLSAAGGPARAARRSAIVCGTRERTDPRLHDLRPARGDRRRERAAHGSRCRHGRARRGGSAPCAPTGAS